MRAACLVLAACLLLPLAAPQPAPCPPRCLCFRTTVRCMFLQLDRVPQVPSHTTILDLRFNKIREIEADAFKDLKDLNTLLLNNNHITRLQNGVFNGLPELRYLYLYKNRLRQIESNVFQGLPKLEQLYLHFNELVDIESGTFTNLPVLERLFLHNNKLQRIPSGAFKNLESLKRLRLDSNALICDCEMLWLVKMLQTKMNGTQAAATCQSPAPMQGKPLTAMAVQDFHCKKPKIIEDPRDVEVTFGGTIFFTCKAEGDPTPDIVWMRDNNEISFEQPRYSKLSDGTLMIENAADSDIGVYECMAKSPAGEAKSRAAKIHYKKNKVKPHFKRTPADQTVHPGGTVRLYCAAAGSPPPDVTWSHDDIPIVTSQRVQLTSDGTLIITDVQPEDAGSYKCTASNFVGRITSIAQVRVNVLPNFITRPENLTVKVGGRGQFTCIVDESSSITWFKDGRNLSPSNRISILNRGQLLQIQHAKESDSGQYVCRAQNIGGFSEVSAYMYVSISQNNVQKDSASVGPPRLVIQPYNMEAPNGSTIEMPCRADGNPRPSITWTKDGSPVSYSKRLRISAYGSMYLSNVSENDAGLYECTAVNEHGEAKGQGQLKVKREPVMGPGDRFVGIAFKEASAAVDRAVNDTLNKLLINSDKPATPSELFRLLRFPNAEARDIARAAEVYERTLLNIKKHVEAGMKLNLTTDFSYKDLLSPSHLELVANLSGCMVHRPHVNCSDMCFHSKYRSIDGTCNNLQHPMWGASLTGFRRVLKPIYENGFSLPIGWKKHIKYYGYPKPSARLVSTEMISTDVITPDDYLTHMVMQWGQFLDHDLDHAIPSVSSESWDGIDCKRSCEYAAPCYPIEIPPNDPRIKNRRCIDFVRSSAICGSGHTSVFFDTVMPREQINQLTSYIDASQVYGFSEEVARDLRDFQNNRNLGFLREGIKLPNKKALLPLADNQPNDCRRDPAESDIGCFLAGDIRSNEQLGLLAMHTIWFREHNRIAEELRNINPQWDGDTVYHEARKIVGAQMQFITFEQWLPNILGPEGMEMLGEYKGYDPNVNPSISNIFATAALRFGHSLINPVLHRLNKTFQPIPQGNVPLHKAFFAPWRLVEEGGVDPLLRGLFAVPAKLKMPHQNLNTDLTEHLFEVAHAVALDLAAINIQRGRDHGIPGYNEWRKFCNLSVAESFDDLRYEISSSSVRDGLRKLYGHPGNIDVWVGGILEDLAVGAKVGPTFRCLLVEQFRRLRDGDRFWYENPSTFKPEQLTQIRQTSLSRVLCDNGDDISEISRNVFLLPKRQNPNFLSCEEIPKIELKFWAECCHSCSSTGRSPFSSSRIRRSAEFSYVTDSPLAGTTFTAVLNNISTSTSPPAQPPQPMTTFNPPPAQNSVHVDKDEVEEERIEGIETAMEEFQRTIKQLRRKIKKLEHHCQMTNKHFAANKCIDDNGHWRKNNEIWKKDNCTDCSCKDKQITCTIMKCAPLQCSSPIHHDGECCPVCA